MVRHKLLSGTLLEESPSQLRILVHPVVLFTILDQFSRRSHGQQRVMGTLLGAQSSGNVVEVTNCFAVPHTEQEDQVAVDIEFYNTMNNLHTRVSPREKPVGWYETGKEMDSRSILVHNEFFAKQRIPPPMIHLVVDTLMQGGELELKAFVSSNVMVGDQLVGTQFHRVAVEIRATEIERTGVGLLYRARQLLDKSGKQPRINDLDTMESSIRKLSEVLTEISNYVNQVLKGDLPLNREIGLALADALTAVPEIDASLFKKEVNDSTQDLLMLTYLTSIARAQLVLSEKIQNITAST